MRCLKCGAELETGAKLSFSKAENGFCGDCVEKGHKIMSYGLACTKCANPINKDGICGCGADHSYVD